MNCKYVDYGATTNINISTNDDSMRDHGNEISNSTKKTMMTMTAKTSNTNKIANIPIKYKILLSLIAICSSPSVLKWLRTVDSSSYGTATVNSLNVKDGFATSAFAKELYPSIYQEPFRSYPCMPKQIHLSQTTNVEKSKTDNTKHHGWFFGRQPTQDEIVSMTLSFTVADSPICKHVEPIILYGKRGSKFSVVHASVKDNGETINNSTTPPSMPITERRRFTFSPMSTNDTYTSDWIYHMVIPNLKAGFESYWYRIQILEKSNQNVRAKTMNEKRWFFFLRGRQRILGESPMVTFRTPPKIGSPCTLALVGDIGQTENSTITMNHVLQATEGPFRRLQERVSAILLVGDLSYADGMPRRWERWLELMEPLLRSTSLQTAAGNHEIECDRITHDVFVPYENYFRNPNRNASVDLQPVTDEYWNRTHYCTGPIQYLGHYNNGNSYYSFVHGMVHVIVLNSYTDTTVGSIQYQWLQQTLNEAVDRTITPWLIVMFHCPLHSTFLSHPWMAEINAETMFENMEPLFVKHHVNIVLSGHDHAFMRTYPMVGRKRDLSQTGPVYVTMGAGGNREQHVPAYINPTKQEEWVAKRDRFEYGYGKLFVANASHAHFQWVRDGTTVMGEQDDTWLINQYFLVRKS